MGSCRLPFRCQRDMGRDQAVSSWQENANHACLCHCCNHHHCCIHRIVIIVVIIVIIVNPVIVGIVNKKSRSIEPWMRSKKLFRQLASTEPCSDHSICTGWESNPRDDDAQVALPDQKPGQFIISTHIQ